jgi:twinkle protein
MIDFKQYNIKVPNGATGDIHVICPNCTPHDRKPKNRNSKDLSVNVERGVWNCHNCGWAGGTKKPKKEYIKPQPRLQKVGDKVLQFFEARGISNQTTLRFGITEAKEWMPQFEKEVPVICFNYLKDGELINIKFRGPEKAFKMAKDAELIFYNMDAIHEESTAIIVEGEIDCLSLHEAGIYNSVSVPNGASSGNQKLEYLDNCWNYFEGKNVILFVDNDQPGESLKNELARRLGKDRCYTVEYPEDCKDANDVLLKFGKNKLLEMVQGAREWPLEGIITMDEMYNDIIDFYQNGYPKGSMANIKGAMGLGGFDDLLSFYPGQLTMVTGSPGSGKDEFLNLIAANLARFEGWKFGICGMEEPAEYTVTKLQEKITGKSFAFRKDAIHRMNQNEFENSLGLVDSNFFFINVNKVTVKMEEILQHMGQLVKKYGINAVIINPWNCLEHNKPDSKSETEYVSEALGQLITFLKVNHVHGFLVAHPTKLQKKKDTGKYEVATMYSISGSAHFFNKTHNGISVYRDFETNVVDVYVQKVKWSWLGKIGFTSFNFDMDTRQYIPF